MEIPEEEETIRCASIDDVSLINEAIGTYLVKPFKPVDTLKLLEVSNVAVTITRNENILLAHASFLDYPDFHAKMVDSAHWVEWLSKKLGHQQYTALNSLFLHSFLSKTENEFYLRKILKEVFSAAPPFMKFCIIFLTEISEIDEAIRSIFTEEEMPEGNSWKLFVTKREDHVTQVLVRPAKVEDADYVNAMLELNTNAFRDTYGEYFLADLLDTHDNRMLTIVAEADGVPVGFMHASCNVDVRLLNECFELECYYGLRNVHVSDEDMPFGVQPLSQTPKRSSSSQNGSVPKSDRSSYLQRLRMSSMHSRQGSCISGSSSRTSISLRRRLTAQRIQNPYYYVKPVKSDTVIETTKQEGPVKHCVPYLPLYIEPTVPKYNGDSNCFCIHIFTVIDGYESGSLEMLMAAYEKFPYLEYCVIAMPYTTPEFCLLKYFFRVSARPLSLFPHSLFLFHKAALLFDFQVRNGIESDMDGIRHLVSSLWAADYLNLDMRLFFRAIADEDKNDFQAFVAECRGQIVAIAVLTDEQDLDYIRSHFQIDDFIVLQTHDSKDHGHLIHCVLNPAFKLMSKMFLKEVLRLSHKKCLYYPVYPAHSTYNESLWQSVLTTFDDLVPLKPRRTIQYDLNKLFEFKPNDGITRKEDIYGVYHFNRKLTFTQKNIVDARIVVVGASETAFGFLETLIFQSDYQFTNLILVSPRGIPSEISPDEQRNAFLTISCDYSQSVMDSLCLHSWVNVMFGTMTAIDRQVKVIEINRETEIAYDYLVLCCGLQFQRPLQHRLSVSRSGEALLRKTSSLEIRVGNVFAINDIYDAALALNWLGEHYENAKGHVIVYGNSLEAYVCIQGLLNAGVMRLKIAFVKSPRNEERPSFGVISFENVMLGALKARDITLYEDYELEIPENKSTVNSVLITSSSKQRSLKCCALFMCKDKEVDHMAFNAISDADLVFDGRLVIDASFKTNDDFIYGAGPFTRLSNRYFAYHMERVVFNSKEIGTTLAKKILQVLYPTERNAISVDKGDELSQYKEPITTHAKLPCEWQYVCIDKPKYKYERLYETGYEKPEVKKLTSGTLFGEDPSFFQLVFNAFNEVETIICFAKEEIEVSNLRQLHGLHYTFLNKIFDRFKANQVKKILDFFREPWSMALYHDCFKKFREDVRELACKRKQADLLSLAEKVKMHLSRSPKLSEEKVKELQGSFKDLGYEDDVKELLRYYLAYYYPDLPMYSQKEWNEKFK